MYTLGDGEIEMEGSPLTFQPVFNSTKYPGVCKPSNERTLAMFKDLQSQLNRVAQAKGIPKIAVDGDIGPGTIKLMTSAAMIAAGTGCSSVASAAVPFTGAARVIADAAGAPATVVSPAPARPSTLVSATGAEVLAPAPGYGGSLVDSWNQLSMPMRIAALGALGGLGYYVYKSSSKKKGRK